ncbi:hypothetical protein LINPERHAP2_LOCUS5759, partial [Linum perenne]
MNPGMDDFATSSFDPPDADPANPEGISADSVDGVGDEEFPPGQVFGVYYPQSEICKDSEDPDTWKKLTFGTLDEFDAFFLEYAHEAGFSMRKLSTKSRRCPSDGIVRKRYAYRVCNREGYRKGSSLDPKNGGVVDATAKGKIIPEFRIGCEAEINARWCDTNHYYFIAEWRVDHNHPLTIPEHRQFMNSARSITPLTALLSKLHDQVGIPVRATYDFLSNCNGG